MGLVDPEVKEKMELPLAPSASLPKSSTADCKSIPQANGAAMEDVGAAAVMVVQGLKERAVSTRSCLARLAPRMAAMAAMPAGEATVAMVAMVAMQAMWR